MTDLLARLVDDDPEARLAALLEAGALRDLSGRHKLIDAVTRRLEDEHPGIRQAALDMLGRWSTFAGHRVSQAVVERAIALTEDASAKVRAEATASLALLSEDLLPTERARALMKRLDDDDDDVRQEALAALGDLKVHEAADPMSQRLEDKHTQVRFEAAFALASLGDARALEPLVAALQPTARRLDACEGLRRLQDPRAIESLTALAKRWFLPWVDRLTVWATLHSLGDPTAGEAVIQKTTSRRFEERSYALALIGSHQIHAGYDVLVEIVGDAKSPHRSTAVQALGKLERPEARGVIEALMAEADLPPALADEARTALRHLTETM